MKLKILKKWFRDMQSKQQQEYDSNSQWKPAKESVYILEKKLHKRQTS